MEQREWYRGCGFCKPSKLGKYAIGYEPKEVTTLNIPLLYLDAIQKLVDLGLYDSRSELIRICVDKFLEKELEFKADLRQNNVKCIRNIVTVNMPKRVNKIIAEVFVDHFAGAKPLYPSRSELIRVAIHDMFMEIFMAKLEAIELEPIPEPDPSIFVDDSGKQWHIKEEI